MHSLPGYGKTLEEAGEGGEADRKRRRNPTIRTCTKATDPILRSNPPKHSEDFNSRRRSNPAKVPTKSQSDLLAAWVL
jgi:hypothetical protein